MAPERRIRLWLFGVLLLGYWLTAGGHFYASDDAQKLQVLVAWAHTGRFAFADGWAVGVDGLRYSWFPLGASLVMLPGFLAGELTTRFVPAVPADYGLRFFVSLQNAAFSAGLATGLYAIGRGLGHARRPALATALTLALGTMIWPYAKTSWSEPAAGLLLLIGLWGLYRAQALARPNHRLLAAAAALAGAAFVRQELALAAAGALAWSAWQQRHTPGRVLAGLPFVLAPFALVGVLTLWYNQARYGAYLAFPNYQQPQAALTPGLSQRLGWALTNLWHYSLNPSQGLLVFNPPVLLGLWGLGAFARRHRDFAALLAVSLVPLALFYVVGWGLSSWSWGLRFAYIFIPWLILPTVMVYENTQRGLKRVAIVAVLALGLGVQLLGVLHNPITLYERILASNPALTVETMMTTPAASPLLAAWQATPGVLQGGLALLSAPDAGRNLAASRKLREPLPDLWYFLLRLSPLPAWLSACAFTLLLGAWLFALWRFKRAFASPAPPPTGGL